MDVFEFLMIFFINRYIFDYELYKEEVRFFFFLIRGCFGIFF